MYCVCLLLLCVCLPHLFSSSFDVFYFYFRAERDERPVIGTGAAPTRRKSPELAFLSSLSPLQAYFLTGVPFFFLFHFYYFIFFAVFGLRAAPNTITIFSGTLGSSLAEAGPGCDVITAGLSLSLSLSLTTRRSRTAAP